ncbi:MAG TPA: DUF305 domain-containing protein [Chloroflexaceae bacterium]|nr:DUF305 domain-containing protein [Chloroflexaceae bacterium]
MDQPISSQPPAEERRPRALGLPAVAGLVLGAALLSLAAALWLNRPPGEGSAEVRFARDMIAHHEQAVEMALIMRDRAADETVRVLADDIILTQQNQSGRMAGWLEVWGRPFAGEEAPMAGHAEAMGMAPQGEVNALRTLPVAEAEARFLQLMITHHEGGVVMARAALDAGARPEVQRLAESIVRGQQQENELMRGLLAARGAEAPPPLATDHEH